MKARRYLLTTAALFVANAAHAQVATTSNAPADTAQGTPAAAAEEDIVVTAVAQGTNRLDSSITTSSINSTALTQLAPRT